MSLSWDSVAIKYLLFIFNLFFVITGIIILSVGSAVKAYYHEFEIFLDDNYFSTSNLLIAIGAIIFLIAFFGCCGAVKENFCMTITFSTLLVLIFILELAAGISGYVLRNNTSEFLKDRLKTSLAHYTINGNDTTTQSWDMIQNRFNCCGVNGPDDWSQIPGFDGMYPLSCCTVPGGSIGVFSCGQNSSQAYIHMEGCATSFGEYIADHAYTIGAVGIGFAVIQALGIIFACRLSKQIKMNYENV